MHTCLGHQLQHGYFPVHSAAALVIGSPQAQGQTSSSNLGYGCQALSDARKKAHSSQEDKLPPGQAEELPVFCALGILSSSVPALSSESARPGTKVPV